MSPGNIPTTTLGQRVLAALWWGPCRRPFEAALRRAWRDRSRIHAGPLAGLRFRGGLAQHLGIYELPVQQILARHLSPGETFYDVGAHRGYFALLAARRVGAAGRVVAFEPLEENADALREHLAANRERANLAPVEVVTKAVGAARGSADLWDGDASTVASLLPTSGGRSRRVDVICLDDFVAEHPAPDFVKVDVEGAEELVLRGAGHGLAAARPIWLIEVHSPASEAAVEKILRQAGYRTALVEGPRRASHPRHLLALPEEGG